jgi:hypothetical protein
MGPPVPGIAPTPVPISEQRSMSQDCRHRSRRLGSSARTSVTASACFSLAVVLHEGVDHMGHGKERDHRNQQVDALLQRHRPEGQPRGALHRVDADGHDHQAKHARDQPAQHRAFGQPADRREAEQQQRKGLGRAEAQRQLGHEVDRDDHHDQADEAAEGRGGDGGAQRERGLAAPRQGVTVDHRGRRRWRARNAQQDGRDRSAGHPPDVGAHQQADGRRVGQGEGHRHDQRHGDGKGQPRNGAEHHAEKAAERHRDDRSGARLAIRAVRKRSMSVPSWPAPCAVAAV